VHGTVTQLHPPRAATRLGPKEARILAQRAREAGLAPGAARALLAHLLRVCDPRQGFVRTLPHRTPPDQDRVTGLTDELGVSLSTLIRAIHALERAGLLEIRRGTGRTWSSYTLKARQVVELLGEVPGSPWATLDFTAGLEGSQSDTPEVSKRHPRGVKMTPPYVRARESDRSKTRNPLPPPAAGPSPTAGPEASPPASGQGPLSQKSRSEQRSEQGSEQVADPCEHGRTLAQGGCRLCGTTARARAQALEREARDQRRREQLAEQLADRNAAADRRARAAPADPATRAERRANLRAAVAATKHKPQPNEKGTTDGDSHV
jgi:DNA-binding MarR family transcriptional regulator